MSANDRDAMRALLDCIPALQRPCDLDLLVFFARHWQALLSGEQLARLLGYPLKEIARSRDVLVAAGLLTRTQDRTRPERMYVLDPECMNGGPLSAIVTLASTPGGRVSLRQALGSVPARATDDVPAHVGDGETPRDARPPGDAASPKRNRSTEERSNEQLQRTQ